jgi:hypothetical protein
VANKISLTLFAAGLLAATVVFATYAPSAAQERPAIITDFSAQQQQENKGQQKKAAPAARSAPQRAAPQRAAPQRAAPQRAAPQRTAPQRSAPREAAPRRTQQRVVAPQKTAPSEVTPRRTAPSTVTRQKAAPRVVGQPKATPKGTAPGAAGRRAVSPAAAPRVVTPSGTRTVTAARLRGVPARGAGRAVIRGQNYSAWRSGYRVRHDGGWWTFVALSTLGAIAIGANQYYPYAYISAPQPYCEGLTEDGCELMWQEVETIEGGVVNQCVAYCPWR